MLLNVASVFALLIAELASKIQIIEEKERLVEEKERAVNLLMAA